MRLYSVVIPVYNRPDEVRELLDSLIYQTYSNFEVLIIEDGSAKRCEAGVAAFQDKLNVQYYFKENTGQGFSRNYGFERAKGDYFVVFDSDTLIPPDYFQTLENQLNSTYLDAYGGPDAARADFSPLQRAISYSMTSLFTTGGIRGQKQGVGTFQPRSYNMGISREVWEKTGGFAKRDMGEDIELSTRMLQAGFRVGLIPAAFVYHKRRGTLRDFFRQVFSFGRTRIQLEAINPGTLKLVHAFPAVFTLFLMSIPVQFFVSKMLFYLSLALLTFYLLLIFFDAGRKTRSLFVAALSIVTALIQLTGYGLGFLREWIVGRLNAL
ncbi:MAG: glycosyltransferase [Cytophagaceae bacterium]|nr:glycosyltransferase [Cytophagaceae bacterium]